MCHWTGSDGNHPVAKTIGAHSACKNRADIDSLGRKGKGAPKNNMEENGDGRDEECSDI